MFNLSAFGGIFLVLIIATKTLAMEAPTEISNHILEPSIFTNNLILSPSPNPSLSFIQVRSIPHNLQLFDVIEEEGKAVLQYLTPNKLKTYFERLKNALNDGRQFCTNLNIGCGKEASGYYAIFNSCAIMKAIFETDKRVIGSYIEAMWDLKYPSKLFWNSTLNSEIMENNTDGSWRKAVLKYRKKESILNWFNSVKNKEDNNLELAEEKFTKIEEEYKKNNLNLNLSPIKSAEEALSGSEVLAVLTYVQQEDVFNNRFNSSNFSVIDAGLLSQNHDYWDNNIRPILNDFKVNSNKAHAFIINENGLWYALILNKSNKGFQYILIDSSNQLPTNKQILKEIFRILKHYQFTKIFNISENTEILKQESESILSEQNQKRGKQEYIGDLPLIIKGLIKDLNNPPVDLIAQGLLLYGPPGRGKTRLAQEIAERTNRKLFAKSGGSFINSFQGSGSESVTELFNSAKAYKKPSIILIDEIDSIACRKNFDSSNNKESNNALDTLLFELDEVENNSNIFVIGATNHFNKLEEALVSRFRIILETNYKLNETKAQFVKKLFSKIPNSFTQQEIDDISTKLSEWDLGAARILNFRDLQGVFIKARLLANADGTLMSNTHLYKSFEEMIKIKETLENENESDEMGIWQEIQTKLSVIGTILGITAFI